MSPSSPVSIHPYFKIHPSKLDAVKTMLPRFVEKTATEEKVLYYEFTLNGEELFCREAYQDAEALLAHLSNVAEELRQMLENADVIRLELHGPASELEKLKAPLAQLNPAWFVRIAGLER